MIFTDFEMEERMLKQMAMRFEELTVATRASMLKEFDMEQAGNPYRSKLLTIAGTAAFPDLMREAILTGNEETLLASLLVTGYWQVAEPYDRNGHSHTRAVNPRQAAERLAITEFNTCYVHGLAGLLQEEGVTECVIYRAGSPRWESGNCQRWEGQTVSVAAVYNGHRATYWPRRNPGVFSVPFGPDCHHSIRRAS